MYFSSDSERGSRRSPLHPAPQEGVGQVGGSSGPPADLRSPEQSYHWPPSSWLMWSCERRRTHSSSEVWKNSTGSFRTLHHSQLISWDVCRHTFSSVLSSAPEQKHLCSAPPSPPSSPAAPTSSSVVNCLTFSFQLDEINRKLQHKQKQRETKRVLAPPPRMDGHHLPLPQLGLGPGLLTTTGFRTILRSVPTLTLRHSRMMLAQLAG